MTEIELEFHRAMVSIYDRAKREAAYTPTRFHQMIAEFGGVETAHRLLATSAVSEGLWMLAQAGRLDLSVEAHVIDVRFSSLFTDAEVLIARRRLEEVRV